MIFTGSYGDSDGECLSVPSVLGDACIDWKFTLIILGAIFLLFTRKVLNWIFGTITFLNIACLTKKTDPKEEESTKH